MNASVGSNVELSSGARANGDREAQTVGESGGQRPCLEPQESYQAEDVLEFLSERAVEPFRSDGAICIRREDFVGTLLAAARENLRVVVLKPSPQPVDEGGTMWVLFQGRPGSSSVENTGDRAVGKVRMLGGPPRTSLSSLGDATTKLATDECALSPCFSTERAE